MRIELINSNGLFNGVKDISDRFGPSALILKNVKSSGQEFLVVAHENAVSDTRLKSSNHNREDLIGKSQQEIEVIKDALEKLPMKINSSARRKHYAQSKTDNGSTSQKSFNDTTSVIKKNFQSIVNAAPISSHIRELLNHIVGEPRSQAELIAELRCGIMKNIPHSVDIKFDHKTHVLTGGHGAGKTTVALKIASQLDSAYQNKVSIVSFGSNDSASTAKLRASGEKLGIPIIMVKDTSELSKILYLKSPEDIYIIDLEIELVKAILPLIRDIDSQSQVQVHLVVPTDSSIEGLWGVCKLDKWESIILTRLDLTLTPWVALEALSRFGIPLSIGSASKDLNSGLVKVENSNVIKSVEDYVVRRIDSEIEQGKSKRRTIASELH
tara:strand:- start:5166 stop:6314 length:1149 start_codon:yes stop_codon:yes gene_type:complete